MVENKNWRQYTKWQKIRENKLYDRVLYITCVVYAQVDIVEYDYMHYKFVVVDREGREARICRVWGGSQWKKPNGRRT